MQGGGHDLSWYESLNESGSRDLDIPEESLGCHVGPYAGLNIVNPQPNFEYSWANNDPRDVLRVRARGGQVVQGDDPEYAAYRVLEDSTNSPIDSANLYQDCILIRTPIEKVRERRDEESNRAEVSARGSVDDFTDRASALEADYGKHRGPTRFSRSEHMMEWEEDGRVEAMWSPESGIVRR
jgi:hypothetical protein